MRGDDDVCALLPRLVREGHDLGISCVNVAEIEHGLRPKERKAARALVERLRYLVTTREGAERAGRYQAELAKRGKTLHTPDALIAGTARSHGAVLLTDNADDFPMRDVRVLKPEALLFE